MKSAGNGAPEQCAVNLLLITRGEVPYDRIKGRDGSLTDSPASFAGETETDAEWLLETFEPRIDVDGVDIDNTLASVGEFGLNARIKTRKEDSET